MIMKPIPIEGIEEPMPRWSKISIDTSYPTSKREHQIYTASSGSFGSVGDRCYSFSEEYLRKLCDEGYLITSPHK